MEGGRKGERGRKRKSLCINHHLVDAADHHIKYQTVRQQNSILITTKTLNLVRATAYTTTPLSFTHSDNDYRMKVTN